MKLNLAYLKNDQIFQRKHNSKNNFVAIKELVISYFRSCVKIFVFYTV